MYEYDWHAIEIRVGLSTYCACSALNAIKSLVEPRHQLKRCVYIGKNQQRLGQREH